MRRLGPVFAKFGFFCFDVSPFRPSGFACCCCVATSSVVTGGGAKGSVLSFFAFGCFARAAKRVFDFLSDERSGLATDPSGFSVLKFEGVSLVATWRSLLAPFAPASSVLVSAVGSVSRGACPNRIFSFLPGFIVGALAVATCAAAPELFPELFAVLSAEVLGSAAVPAAAASAAGALPVVAGAAALPCGTSASEGTPVGAAGAAA